MQAIINAKVLTVTNGTFEKGTILVEDGKIKEVGENIQIPQNAEIIDANGLWVTPGLIDAHTHISNSTEPGNIFADKDDGNEITNPNTSFLRVIDCINPFSLAIERVRNAGFTTCYVTPGSANVIGGTGISIKLKNANSVSKLAIEGSEMMKMALGENPKRAYGARGQYPQTRMGIGAILRENLFKAKQYSDELAEAESNPEKKFKHDFRMDSLVPVIRGQMKCRIHVHRADDIVTAIRIMNEFGLKYSIEHGSEGYKIMDILKENNVDLVVGPLLTAPVKNEVWGCRLDTPAVLEENGINFCLCADEESKTQWLPVIVGIAMKNGLSFEAALQAVTIRAAKLLELDNRIGSIEPGKDADLAFFDGMPFSNLTTCKATMIDGKFEHKIF